MTYKFTRWLIDGEGGYAYYIAPEVRAQFKGLHQDSLYRKLNFHSGCQSFKFFDSIPKNWQNDNNWAKNEVHLTYDKRGYLL